MTHETLYLEDYFPSLPDTGRKTTLSLYLQSVYPEIDEKRKFPCVVICPGGGYSFTSAREAEPIALRFLAAGINAVVVWYACAPARYPTQLLEASAAVALVRRKAEAWHCDPDRIAVMGFSAGGHLAGSVGVFWQEELVWKTLGLKQGENKPNGMILCYPVLTSGDRAHRGSFENLLGEGATEEQLEKVSLEKQVTKHAPKAFIWHTVNDGAVPVENALLMASALQREKVSYELHIYPDGVHGLSLCDETTARVGNEALVTPYVATWFPHLIEWIRHHL